VHAVKWIENEGRGFKLVKGGCLEIGVELG